jgi:hypothetical protein
MGSPTRARGGARARASGALGGAAAIADQAPSDCCRRLPRCRSRSSPPPPESHPRSSLTSAQQRGDPAAPSVCCPLRPSSCRAGGPARCWCAAAWLLRGCAVGSYIYTLGGVLVRSSRPTAVYQRDDLACIPILCCLLTVLLTHAAIIIIAAAATAANVENCWLW